MNSKPLKKLLLKVQHKYCSASRARVNKALEKEKRRLMWRNIFAQGEYREHK
jgi:hypothetical protein